MGRLAPKGAFPDVRSHPLGENEKSEPAITTCCLSVPQQDTIIWNAYGLMRLKSIQHAGELGHMAAD